MEFVVSEIDMGDGSTADAGTQAGDSGAAAAFIPSAEPRQVGDEQSAPEAAASAIDAGRADTSQPGTTDEEGINWATAPEQFRNSYQKHRALREQAERERDTYKTEVESLRSRQTRDVYLSTDIPLEDFKPDEALQRMAQEEPEYHDKVVEAVLGAHLWPNIGSTFTSLEGKVFGRFENGAHVFDNEEERMQYHQITQVWDTLARRVSGVSGDALTRMISTVGQHPAIMHAIEEAMAGRTVPDIQGSQQRGQQGYQQGTPSLEAVAAHYNLDLSDPDHVAQAQAHLAAAKQITSLQSQFSNELRARDARIRDLESKFQKVDGTQKQVQTTTTAEAERQAEGRVAEHLRTSIDTEFTEKYARAIPKDRTEIGDRLKTLTRERLNTDPNFQQAKAAATKWYKQAATAGPEARPRYEQKALDAMGVMTTLRAVAMAEEAKVLLGKLPAQTAAARARTAANASRRELPGGSTAQPAIPAVPATAPGNIDSMRLAVRERMKKAGVNMPG